MIHTAISHHLMILIQHCVYYKWQVLIFKRQNSTICWLTYELYIVYTKYRNAMAFFLCVGPFASNMHIYRKGLACYL